MRLNQLHQRLLTVWQSEPRLLKVVISLIVLNTLFFGAMSLFVSPAIMSEERAIIQLQSEVRRTGAGDVPLSASQLYNRSGEDLQRVYALIPEQARLSDLILDISQLAGKAGFEITSISYDPKPVEDFPLLGYTLSFTVQGNYRQLKKFVYLLEASSRIVTLDGISLVESKDSDVSMRIKMTTFFKEQGGQ